MEITNKFFERITTTFAAPRSVTALGIGRLNEISYVKYLSRRLSPFSKVIDLNGTYADVMYKVDVIVMHNDDIDELIQAYPVYVVYPDENGIWRTIH